MRGTKIIKRARSVECAIERMALILNSRVPNSIGHPRGSRSRAVTTRAPSPVHCIARVNRYRRRREAEAIIANGDCNRDRTCGSRIENQKGSDNRRHYREA
jgi:hypothetical protein